MLETQRVIAIRCETQGHTTWLQLIYAFLFMLNFSNIFGRHRKGLSE